MNFPTTTEELLKALCDGKEPTDQDKEYAEALSELSRMNYDAGYQSGCKDKPKNCVK